MIGGEESAVKDSAMGVISEIENSSSAILSNIDDRQPDWLPIVALGSVGVVVSMGMMSCYFLHNKLHNKLKQIEEKHNKQQKEFLVQKKVLEDIQLEQEKQFEKQEQLIKTSQDILTTNQAKLNNISLDAIRHQMESYRSSDIIKQKLEKIEEELQTQFKEQKQFIKLNNPGMFTIKKEDMLTDILETMDTIKQKLETRDTRIEDLLTTEKELANTQCEQQKQIEKQTQLIETDQARFTAISDRLEGKMDTQQRELEDRKKEISAEENIGHQTESDKSEQKTFLELCEIIDYRKRLTRVKVPGGHNALSIPLNTTHVMLSARSQILSSVQKH